MPNFESVFSNRDLSIVRVIATALQAHGFDVQDVDQLSFPGVGGRDGFHVRVPGEQAADARLLAEDFFSDMGKD